MDRSAADALDAFNRRSRRLLALVGETSQLHSRGGLTQRSLDATVESTLLDLYAGFEQFLEDLFYSCLLNKSGIVGVQSRIPFQNREQADLALLRQRDYVDWLPYKANVRDLAITYLASGAPFTRLDRHPSEMQTLEEIRKIRNAIAHDSTSAHSKILHLTTTQRARRRHPAGVLLELIQGRSRHERYVATLGAVAAALASATDRAAQQYLSPEIPYEVGDPAPKGKYQCVRCRLTYRVTTRNGRLPSCTGSHSPQAKWLRIY